MFLVFILALSLSPATLPFAVTIYAVPIRWQLRVVLDRLMGATKPYRKRVTALVRHPRICFTSQFTHSEGAKAAAMNVTDH